MVGAAVASSVAVAIGVASGVGSGVTCGVADGVGVGDGGGSRPRPTWANESNGTLSVLYFVSRTPIVRAHG